MNLLSRQMLKKRNLLNCISSSTISYASMRIYPMSLLLKNHFKFAIKNSKLPNHQQQTKEQKKKIQISRQQIQRVRNIINNPQAQPSQNDPNFFDSQQQNLSFELMQQQNKQGVINIAKRYISQQSNVNLQFLVFYRFLALTKQENNLNQYQMKVNLIKQSTSKIKLPSEIETIANSMLNRIEQLDTNLFLPLLRIISQNEHLKKKYTELVKKVPKVKAIQVLISSELNRTIGQQQAQIILGLVKLHGSHFYSQIKTYYILEPKVRYRLETLVQIFQKVLDPSIMPLIQFSLIQMAREIKQQGKQLSEEIYQLILQYQRAVIFAIHSESKNMDQLAQLLLKQQHLLRVLPVRKKIDVIYNILTKQLQDKVQIISSLLDESVQLIVNAQQIQDLITSNQVQNQGITEEKMKAILLAFYFKIWNVIAIVKKQKIKNQLQDSQKLKLTISWLMKQSLDLQFDQSSRQDLFQVFVNFSFMRLSIDKVNSEQFEQLQYLHARKMLQLLKLHYLNVDADLDELAIIAIMCKKMGLQELVNQDISIFKKLEGYSGKFSKALHQ